jgi:probable rRNA maturation factor
MPLSIEVEDDGWVAVRGLKSLAQKAVDAALPAKEKKKEISILFAGDTALKVLNKDWRGKNMPTNVLSFPAPDDVKLPRGAAMPLGDIALSFDTVAREAKESGKTLKHHTTHLIVHGVLHLLGYDHIHDADAAKMEAREVRILKKLGIADPYQN